MILEIKTKNEKQKQVTRRLTIEPDEMFDNEDYGLYSEGLIVITFHRHYRIGQKHNFEKLEDALKFYPEEKFYNFPLYMYDHSNLTFSLTSFNDNWDSGLVGCIFIDKKWAKQNLTDVEVYVNHCIKIQNYIECGAVYFFKDEEVTICNCCGHEITKQLDSCGGYIGYLEEVKEKIVEEIPIYKNAKVIEE